MHPALPDYLCHPSQNLYLKPLSAQDWVNNFDSEGRIVSESRVKEHIFFAGCAPEIRSKVWPFLLDLWKWSSTQSERLELLKSKTAQYQAINKRRISINENGHCSSEWAFLTEVQSIVEKDVLRTDRQYQYFSGSGNKNLDKLRRILLNYSTLTQYTYTQGMSDLLSPLLMHIEDEALCFWCFVGLMEKNKYINSLKYEDMKKELILLRRLIKLILPKFYRHILNMGPGAQDLLFAHRWLILMFKREWSDPKDSLLVWECTWSECKTKYMHLFIACAFIELYGQDPMVHKLDLDETLLYLTQVAGNADADEVLRRARKLVHNIQSRISLPCYVSWNFVSF